MAEARRKRLITFIPALAGLAVGTGAALLPAPYGLAAGLFALGAGGIASFAIALRRVAAERDELAVALGEVKVRLAASNMRMDALGQRFEQQPMSQAEAAPARAAIAELTAEVGLLGDLIQQVATTLADHDEQLKAKPAKSAVAPAAAPAAPLPAAPEPARFEPVVATRFDEMQAAQLQASDARAGAMAEAIAQGRVEIHLQPIVQLPHRRTRGYEALVRLRLDEATLLLPAEFLGVIEARGLGPALDALVLTRALAIARHLAGRQGGHFVSCNFSAATWSSAQALASLARLLERYQEHIGHLVIEMPQAVFRNLDPASLGLLGAMSAHGVRFALDHVSDLRLDPVSLHDRGVRFVKVPAELLLALDDRRSGSDIAAGDVAAMLARSSIALVAERIEDDPTVADMLELGVGYAQGFVFAQPRPVKPDVFAEPAALPATAPEAASPPSRTAAALPEPVETGPTSEQRLPLRAVLRRAIA